VRETFGSIESLALEDEGCLVVRWASEPDPMDQESFGIAVGDRWDPEDVIDEWPNRES